MLSISLDCIIILKVVDISSIVEIIFGKYKIESIKGKYIDPESGDFGNIIDSSISKEKSKSPSNSSYPFLNKIISSSSSSL